MLFKLILLSLLLLGAYAVAVLLLRRLNSANERIAALHEQMARNDSRLDEQMQALRREQARQDAQTRE